MLALLLLILCDRFLVNSSSYESEKLSELWLLDSSYLELFPKAIVPLHLID